MAGSFNHIVDDNGQFSFDSIENMGDAYECAEECFHLVWVLTGGSKQKLDQAIRYMYIKWDQVPNPTFKEK